jgi:L-aminopeptidase/D-esterase-like protein
MPRNTRKRRRPSLTDVDGIRVGHWTSDRRPTGCTVITANDSFTAGADVRGGAPGTRETDLLRPENSVERIDAIFLSGGSAFGLESAAGVSRRLEERKRGFATPGGKVPIVCGAVLYDLTLGDSTVRPDAAAGYEATRRASRAAVAEGNVGAGAGATVGKLWGAVTAMKGGLGSWSLELPGGHTVGALAVVNAVGDVLDPSNGRIVAGARRLDKTDTLLDAMAELRRGRFPAAVFPGNTVLAVVATDVALSKSECRLVSRMAHSALSRCIYPSHTPYDGDTVFTISTGRRPAERGIDTGILGALAADVLGEAILRGVRRAESWEDIPAAGDINSDD